MMGCAYYEGYWMALDGAARESNPYEPTGQSIEWLSWADGWQDAQEERRVSDR
jgi:ribosome modulation factor